MRTKKTEMNVSTWLGLVLLAITFACATPAPQPPAPAPRQAPLVKPALPTGPQVAENVGITPEPAPLLHGELLKNVRVSRASFNPRLGEEVSIGFDLERPARVELWVYDADWGLVQKAGGESLLPAGSQSILWDGRDVDGTRVPDEAYFFALRAEEESGKAEIYDPTIFSGGAVADITDVDIRPETGTLHYRLPEMGRVLIRIGTTGGPLLHTLVDWKPRVKGAITEYWDGMDQDDLVELVYHPDFRMLVTYFTLPENSVIAYGNRDTTYAEYKELAGNRATKEDRGSSGRGVSPHYRQPRATDRPPRIQVSFTPAQEGANDGVPVLKDRALVRVELDERDRAFFESAQFEIVFFLDLAFHAEDEAGYTPFNWVWDLSGVEPGEHLLTVNISSFKDQIGVLTRKVKVVR